MHLLQDKVKMLLEKDKIKQVKQIRGAGQARQFRVVKSEFKKRQDLSSLRELRNIKKPVYQGMERQMGKKTVR